MLRWLNIVMEDKIFYTAVINDRLTKTIGLDYDILDNLVRIMRNASKELIGSDIATGRISNILIEKKSGLWKIVVFKEKQASKPGPVS